MTDRLTIAFPGLASTPYQRTSPADPSYNCIAWAAGRVSEWWWPLGDPRKTYWPSAAPREPTVEAFRIAFSSLGYISCAEVSLEEGFEKVAIFADPSGAPMHAARQLPIGRWTSKLGQAEDIEHELHALEGYCYGSVALIMKRRLGIEPTT